MVAEKSLPVGAEHTPRSVGRGWISVGKLCDVQGWHSRVRPTRRPEGQPGLPAEGGLPRILGVTRLGQTLPRPLVLVGHPCAARANAPMRQFARRVRRHEQDILNSFRMPIDNGTVEGLNNKAELVIHKAYGFRTAANYIRNLYHCLGELLLRKLCIHLCEEPVFV